MVWHIVKKEILENFLSLRFAITCIICFLVVSASIAILGKEYVDDLYDYTRNRREHRDELEKKGHPWEIIYRGVTIDKPISKMSIFNKGIDDNGRSAKLFGFREAEYYTKKGKNPVTFLFPSIDLLFFVSVIMSLLAIVFSYDAISGEKFNETLKLMVSYPVSRSSVILGKWIGGYVCLMLPFAIATVSGLILLFIMVPDMELARGDVVRLILLLALASIFVSIVYTFGIMISACTEKPSTSITVLLLTWVVFVLIVPNISSSLASFFTETGNVQEIEGKKRKVVRESWNSLRRKMREYRKKHGYSWRDPEFRLYVQKLRKKQYEETRRSLENINRRYRLKMDAQVKFTKWISRISPLASLKYAAGLLTETGYMEDYNFRRAVEEYGYELMTFCYDEWAESEMDRLRAQSGLQGSREWKFTPERAPKFDYGTIKKSRFEYELAEVLIDVGLLICWNVIFFLGAYILFIRYDVK